MWHKLSFNALQNVVLFDKTAVLASLLILTISLIACYYNKMLEGSTNRNLLITLATIFSITAISSRNFIITFIAIEVLSAICFLLVVISKSVKRRVSLSYFLIHAFAGIILLIAITIQYNQTKSLHFDNIISPNSLVEKVMLAVFIINCALFPFMNWYIKTYSKTDAFSLIILSVITTKTSFFVFSQILPSSEPLFKIGILTLIVSAIFGIMTQNVIKCLLWLSAASLGFDTMALSYNDFQVNQDITKQITYHLAWYISSGTLAVSGFLVLYGFISKHECKCNKFSDIKEYFENHGSSIHFVIPLIFFGLYIASAPLTTSFIAKNNIIQFFVEEKIIYTLLKFSQIIFLMFVIKLIKPVFYGVEFFKLNATGKKVGITLYMFVFLLVSLTVAAFMTFKIKFTFFAISVEFFTFIAYVFIATFFLMIVEFILKITNAKRFIEIIMSNFHFIKVKFFRFIKKLNTIYKTLALGEVFSEYSKESLVLSGVSNSFLIGVIIIFLGILSFLALNI